MLKRYAAVAAELAIPSDCLFSIGTDAVVEVVVLRARVTSIG